MQTFFVNTSPDCYMCLAAHITQMHLQQIQLLKILVIFHAFQTTSDFEILF